MPATGSRRAETQPLPEPSLPSNFTKIRDILDGHLSPGNLVNVMALVKDCRLPVSTRGSDFKCTLTLFDLSIEDEEDGLVFSIFRPEDDMPQVSAADIVVLSRAKVQQYRADPMSLITHYSTSIRVYAASKIPRPPKSAKVALDPAPKRDNYAPSDAEHHYVSQLYHKINKYSIPEEDVFKERAERSLNVKNKFSLLKDVQDGRFYDLIARVATEPYIGVEMATLYVSDYTENQNFHQHQWEGLPELCTAGGDQYGYTSCDPGLSKKEWFGPPGKMSIQITCYEPHASIIRDEVSARKWVALRNVQIKYGRDCKYLEGFLRGDRVSASTRIGVQVLEPNDPDPNLKEAIRRLRDYTKKKEKQDKDIKAAQAAGQKRKAAQSVEQEGRPLNSRDRRNLKRAAKEQKEKEKAINEELRLRLNDRVTCETHRAPYSTIGSVLEPTMYETTVRGQKTALVMPFTCAKYQVRVRVVDFFPPSLQDFACSRRPTEFDVLSDNEDDSDALSTSSSASDEDSSTTNRVWEWRFALQLEDPGPPAAVDSTATKNNKKKPDPRRRLWVLVDNPEAELLTGLDAVDLRRDPATLAQLRERMFTLWGDLEEHKARAAERRREKGRADPREKGKGRHPRPGEKPPLRLQKPPLESSDEEEEEGRVDEEAVSNKPFTCCIQQYGIHDKEAGKWIQCFGLFGTKICR